MDWDRGGGCGHAVAFPCQLQSAPYRRFITAVLESRRSLGCRFVSAHRSVFVHTLFPSTSLRDPEVNVVVVVGWRLNVGTAWVV